MMYVLSSSCECSFVVVVVFSCTVIVVVVVLLSKREKPLLRNVVHDHDPWPVNVIDNDH